MKKEVQINVVSTKTKNSRTTESTSQLRTYMLYKNVYKYVSSNVPSYTYISMFTQMYMNCIRIAYMYIYYGIQTYIY